MSNIGIVIKSSRLEKNIKQANLAKGICSVSYLSKVENDKLFPSDNILLELLNRLELELKKINKQEEIDFLIDFKNKYKNAVIGRDKDLIKFDISTYNEQKIFLPDGENSNNVLLMLIRMYIISEYYKDVGILMEHVILSKDKLTTYQQCILSVNLALLSYSQCDYLSAVNYIEEALYYKQVVLLEKWELADLYNIASICYLVTSNYHSSIVFSTKSLNIFRDQLFFNRSIDCFVTAGIAYKRIKKYSDAEDYFQSALLLVHDRGLVNYEGIIFQNLGSLYSIQKDFKRSISYYIKSLNSKKEREGYLTTIFSIVKENSKLNNRSEVLKWCKRGLELQLEDKEKNKSFFYHFKILEEIHTKSSNFPTLLINALLFFNNINDYRHVSKYSILLAEYYSDKKQLKNATLYYKKSVEADLMIKSISYWEDL